MTTNRSVLGVVLAMLCVGCAGTLDSHLEPRRQTLAATYKDQSRPMSERVAAFDDLLDTFTSGTRESTLDRFVGWPVAQTKSRIDGPADGDVEHWKWKLGGTFSLHLIAPDGSDRWLTMNGDRVQ